MLIEAPQEKKQSFTHKQCFDMIDRGLAYYQQTKFTMAKIVLVNASQILVKMLKEDDIPAPDKPYTMDQLKKAMSYAEDCNKRIELSQKQIMQVDPYARQIIETSLIRKCDISFEQIAGLEQTKNQLYEAIILPNLRPDLFTGIRAPPKGILFFGPPGNGKTLLAKAVANQIKCCFFNVSASTLVQKHLGEGEKLMKSLFRVAGLYQPSVIFIDEIDSMLSARSKEEHEASRRLKTEFLVQFDGVQSSDEDKIVFIAATNRPQDIDDAVLRRFSIKILIDQPDFASRNQLLRLYLKEVHHSLNDQQIKIVNQKLQGYSASDIKAVVKEASMQPLRSEIKNQMILSVSKSEIRSVNQDDFMKAIVKIPATLNAKQLLEYQKFDKRGN